MTQARHYPRATRAAVIVGLALGPLAACGDDPAEPSVAPTPEPSLVVTGQIDQPAEMKKGWEGVRADVSLQECPVTAGPITASGTVLNTADEARDIAILISWNRPKTTDTLLQLGVTKLDVPAGKTVAWEISGELPSDSGACIINARSGQTKS